MSVKIGTLFSVEHKCEFRSKNKKQHIHIERDDIIIVIDDSGTCFTALYKTELIVIDKEWLSDPYSRRASLLLLNEDDYK